MSADILIVDDEADIRDLVAGILQDEGHRTRLARDSDEALRAIEDRKPHLVILDIWLQGSRLDGLEVLTIMKRTYPDLPVVIISGHGNIETAVTAIKRGAYDYIEKPFKADRLVLVALRALEASQLKREVKSLKERSVVSAEMIGKSPAINQLKNNIEKAAPTNSRIMLRGASGSGKELAARVLHQKSIARRWSLRRPQRGGDGARSCRRRTLRYRGPHRRAAQGRGARRGTFGNSLYR